MRFRYLFFILFTFFLNDGAARAAGSPAYGKIPLRFEANVGQTDKRVKFLSRGSGYGLFLTDSEAILRLPRPAPATVRIRLAGQSSTARVEGLDPLPGKTHYLKGSGADTWHEDLPTYGRIRYAGVYPGIDVVYYGNQRQLEYDLVIAPGARPDAIQFRFDGVRGLGIDESGELVLKTAVGEIRQAKPSIYQQSGGQRVTVEGGYVLRGKRSVGFKVGAYDPAKPLVIDPTLVYSTYYGGTGTGDQGNAIAVDAAGNAYITGQTTSADLFIWNGAQAKLGGQADGFVLKLDPQGTTVLYATYFGGSSNDEGHSIAVDAGGNAYVTGFTSSSDFPIVNGFQRTRGGGQDAYLLKLNSTGSAIVFSTYLGGSADDRGYGVAVDAGNNAYVTGATSSNNFPLASPLQRTNAGGLNDVFVTKVEPAGGLIYSTYVGGVGVDQSYAVAVDTAGSAYVVGFTTSLNFPVVSAFKNSFSGGADDAFAFKLNAAGSALVYSTYLGGNVSDNAVRVAVDESGSAYITGYTGSADFPTANAYNPTWNGDFDVFITRLSPDGQSLIFSTFFGGGDVESGTGIAIDRSGAIYVSGFTSSFDFPVINSMQDRLQGDRDAFVAKFSPDGSTVVYSTFLGGTGVDAAVGLAVDTAGNAYITGFATSGDFPIATPFQPASSTVTDTFVSKINASDVVASSPFQIASQGGTSLKTAGTRGELLFGYATAQPSTPAAQLTGLAILDFKQLGQGGTEVAVLAPRLTELGRMFVEVTQVIRTVISVVNPNDDDASVQFYFTDSDGSSTKFVTVTVPAHGHFSRFVNDDPLLLDNPSAGTLSFTSSVPIAASAFRTFVNESNEFVISATPIADPLNVPDQTAVIPEFADGAGWNSQVVLVNPTENDLNGEVRFLDQAGNPMEVGIDDGSSGASVLEYGIPPRSAQRFVTSGTSARSEFPFTARGTFQMKTPGTNFNPFSGYAVANAGAPVNGLQFLEYRKDNVTNSQVGLPASPLIRSGRLFVELTNTVRTQLSIANPSGQDAEVDFFFTDNAGNSSGFDSLIVPAGGQFSGNIGDSPIPIPSATGTISFTSSVPVAVTALRILTNENTASVISQIPVADVNTVLTQPLVIPHFVDGAEWNTQIVLVNTTENPMNGEVRFKSQDGSPLEVGIGGGSASVLQYLVPPRSYERIDTAGGGDSINIGSLQVFPFEGNFTPYAYASLNLRNEAVTVLQTMVQGQLPATSFSTYAEAFGDFDARAARSTRTSIALANPSSLPVTVALELRRLDGTFASSTSPIQIPANGQIAVSLDQLFANGVPAPFQGVLGVRVSSGSGITGIAFRTMINERGDFLAAVTGPFDEQAASGRLIFPYIADGSGYTSQFKIIGDLSPESGGGPARSFSGVINFIAQDASPLFIDEARVGSVQIAPFAGAYTPDSHVILSHKELGTTKFQTDVPGQLPGKNFRMYVDGVAGFEAGAPGSVRTGIAIANPSSAAATVQLDLTDLNGVTLATNSIQLSGNGEIAFMLNDVLGSIPQTVQGVLKLTVTSGSGVTAAGYRASFNANGNLLLTTTGPLVEDAGVPGLLVFPHIAEGGGYRTRFVIIGGASGQSDTGVLSFFNQTGAPVNLVLSGQ